VIGDALVRTWGLPETIARAVRHHHQVVQLPELDVPMETRTLIALSGVAREVVARAAGHKRELWPGEMPAIAEVLGDDVDTLEARVEELVREPDSDA
jgi:HD-like signal output (HDOD) protein